jgi:peptide deformylase
MDAGPDRIRRFGNGCLRRIAEPVDFSAAGTRELLDIMWVTLARDGGVGLAAPQIDRQVRVVIIKDPERPRGQQRIELVNPEIISTFGPRVPFEEGCLSFPGLYTGIMRPKGVEVSCDTPDGRLIMREEGLASRIIQHEVDHLDGVLFIDHLSAWGRFMLWPRLVPFLISEGWRKLFA